jgi:hypothetical protein
MSLQAKRSNFTFITRDELPNLGSGKIKHFKIAAPASITKGLFCEKRAMQ